jgi:hypothetical protein
MAFFIDQPQYIIYYVFCCIAIIANVMVLVSLWKIKNSKTCFTFLLYFLHSTSILMSIFSFPYVWKEHHMLCEIIQSFDCYISIMNLLTVAFLVETHRTTVIESLFDIRRIVHQYGYYLLFGPPSIVFFGFATGVYGSVNNAFCLIESDLGAASFLSLYYLWAWLILIFSTLRTIDTISRIMIFDKKLAKRFFGTIGIYIVVAILTWLPRSLVRFAQKVNNDDDDQYDNGLLLSVLIIFEIGAIGYCFIYFREKASIKLFEAYRTSFTGTEINDEDGFLFTWDEVITQDMLLRTTSVESAAPTKLRPSLLLWGVRPSMQTPRQSALRPSVNPTRPVQADQRPSVQLNRVYSITPSGNVPVIKNPLQTPFITTPQNLSAPIDISSPASTISDTP